MKRKKTKRHYIPNKSKKIPDGTVLNTKDSFLPGGYRSRHLEEEAKHPERLYRMVLVIDTNRNNELAIVEFETKGRLYVNLVDENGDFSAYGKVSDIIHVQNAQGRKLKRKDGALVTNKAVHVSEEDATRVKKDVLDMTKTLNALKNRTKLNTMKKRVYKKKKGS